MGAAVVWGLRQRLTGSIMKAIVLHTQQPRATERMPVVRSVRGPARPVASSLSERTRFVAERPHFCSKIGRIQGVIACFRKETSHKQGV